MSAISATSCCLEVAYHDTNELFILRWRGSDVGSAEWRLERLVTRSSMRRMCTILNRPNEHCLRLAPGPGWSSEQTRNLRRRSFNADYLMKTLNLYQVSVQSKKWTCSIELYAELLIKCMDASRRFKLLYCWISFAILSCRYISTFSFRVYKSLFLNSFSKSNLIFTLWSVPIRHSVMNKHYVTENINVPSGFRYRKVWYLP